MKLACSQVTREKRLSFPLFSPLFYHQTALLRLLFFLRSFVFLEVRSSVALQRTFLGPGQLLLILPQESHLRYAGSQYYTLELGAGTYDHQPRTLIQAVSSAPH